MVGILDCVEWVMHADHAVSVALIAVLLVLRSVRPLPPLMDPLLCMAEYPCIVGVLRLSPYKS